MREWIGICQMQWYLANWSMVGWCPKRYMSFKIRCRYHISSISSSWEPTHCTYSLAVYPTHHGGQSQFLEYLGHNPLLDMYMRLAEINSNMWLMALSCNELVISQLRTRGWKRNGLTSGQLEKKHGYIVFISDHNTISIQAQWQMHPQWYAVGW